MRRIAAALTLTALILAGCGGDDDEPTAESGETSETTAAEGDGTTAPGGDGVEPGADGACPYLTTAALDEAFGVSFEEQAGNDMACSFSDGDGLSVQLTRVDIQIDPETYAEESTSSCEDGSVVEVDAGDTAYACIAIGPIASYFEGDVLINLGVLSADDEQAVVDAFVEVLPSITLA